MKWDMKINKVVSDQPSGRKFLGDISNSKSIGD